VSNNAIGGSQNTLSSKTMNYTAPMISEDYAESVSSDKMVEYKSAPVSKAKKEGEKGDVFRCVEQTPEYPGGQQAMMQFIKQNLQYPKKAAEMGISGKVVVRFCVDEKGDITDIKIVRSIGGGCDEEAIRIIKKMGNWKPGKQNGKAVKTYFTLPISFSLKGK